MRLLPALALVGAALLHAGGLASASAAAPAAATTVTFRVPPGHALPNPRSLPPSTHATLTARGAPRRAAPLTAAHGFVFRNVSAGSYLLDVHCPTHAFAPLRVDVEPVLAGASGASAAAAAGRLRVRAWETYRGNDWGNRGEAVAPDADGALEVRVLGRKDYFLERSKFSVFSILKNPMILLGLVSTGLFIGMPYLVDNMDPEMREEWEKSQKGNPMSSLMGGGGGAQAASSPMGNFDMASFLAGAGKKEGGGASGAGGK